VNAQVRPCFLLKKDWRDAEPGIELVEIRYACAPSGKPPEWRRDEQSRVLVPQGDDPLPYRRCVIALPCGLGKARAYVLHYYFLAIQHGRQRTLPVIEEEIVSREVSCRDERGRYHSVGVQWSVGDAVAPNYTPLVAEPLASGAGHLFRGQLWGPRGSTVYYVFHLDPAREAALGAASCRALPRWKANHGRLWQKVL
jgi:hypothetical protein